MLIWSMCSPPPEEDARELRKGLVVCVVYRKSGECEGSPYSPLPQEKLFSNCCTLLLLPVKR